MEGKSPIQVFNMAKVTDSVNGRLIVLECSRIIQNKLLQITLIKVVHLIGNWPQGPTLFKRKNYQNLYEFVRYNFKKLPIHEFIKNAISDLMKFSAPEILYQAKQNPSIIPTELFVSNFGNRVSFWMTESNFQHIFNILTKLSLTELLKDFQWISQNDQLYSNEIQYGSQNFINLIEKLSLQSMMKVLSMKDYIKEEYEDVTQTFNSVFSLVNYNYRYFYPPKDATRFLKKTSGVVLLAKEKFKEQRSKRWAESVLLQSILELRPTFYFAVLFANPQGPLYQKKYVFSQQFYSSIEKIYFLGNIVDYFNKDNLRNDLKYFTFISRIFPDYLSINQIQPKIQKLKQQGWIRKEDDFHFYNSHSDSQIEEDSEQDQKQGQNKEENAIITFYKDSRSYLMKQCRKQLSQTINKLAQKQSQRNNLDQNQLHSDKYLQQMNEVKLSAQTLEMNQFCTNASVQICISCGFSYSTVSYEENQFSEFLAMFNHGNDKFCYTCSNLSFKDKMISQKERIKAALKAIHGEDKKENQAEENIMKKKEIKQFISEGSKSQETKTNTENQKLTSEDSQKTSQNNLNEQKFCTIAQKVENTVQQQSSSQEKIINEHEIQQHNKTLNKKHKKMENSVNEAHRDTLIAEQFVFSCGMMNLFLKNQTAQVIPPQFFHDSLQLSQLAGFLTTQERISEDLLVIYHFYFESVIRYDMKNSRNKMKFLRRIPYLEDNLTVLNQRKYMKVESNVFQLLFSKVVKVVDNQSRLFSIQNEQQQLTNNLYAFLQIKLEEYKVQISEHYRTYKNVMNQQYKVTETEMKEMIAKFQIDLKNSIIKTTQQFFLISRWIMLFLSEYIQFKTIQFKKNKTVPEQQNEIVYFINQIEFLLNLIATLVNVFNQPGQIKIVEQLETEILNLVFLYIQNEKLIQQHSNLSFVMDLQVVGVLITDMIDHFVAKKGSEATEDAKKLSNKHYHRFKSILQSKLKTLTVKRILDFDQEIKTLQMKIASQSLISVSKKDILTIKNLYVEGELNSSLGYFSSLLYLERYFQKNQSSFHNNWEIKAHIGLLGFAMEMCQQNDKLVLRSKSQPKYRIRFGIMYKIILQTIQKPQQAAQLISLLRSGNKILIELINYLIVMAYELATKEVECRQIADKLEMYIERVMHNHLRYTVKSTPHYNEISQILQFLFKHRNRFFNIEDRTVFEIQLHMIIQIVILNAFPLYNIQLAYKSQLKEIMKELREFDTRDNYNEVEDYYLKVVAFRHDKAKDKRKREIATKKEK